MTTVQVEIDWYPPSVAAATLGIAEPTLRAWRVQLEKANIPEFDHEAHDPTITSQAMRVYRRYKELKTVMKAKKAAKTIRLEGIPDEQFS